MANYFGEPIDLPGCLECDRPSDTWICTDCEENARVEAPTDFAGWPVARRLEGDAVLVPVPVPA